MSSSLVGASAPSALRPVIPGLFLEPAPKAVTAHDHVLKGMVAAGHGIEAICFFLGIARDALLDRIVGLDLPTPHERAMRRPYGKRPWAAISVQCLIGFWVSGARVVSIAGELDRSPGSVSSKARRLGLPKRDRSRLHRLEPRSAASPVSHAAAAGGLPPRRDDASTALSSTLILKESTKQHVRAEAPPRPPQLPHPPRSTSEGFTGPVTPAIVGPRQALARPIEEKGAKRAQSRPGETIWTKDLDLELSMRGWANQHPQAITRDMQQHGTVTPRAISSRLNRLQIPRRDRSQLVDHYDPTLGQTNLRASGYVLCFCSIKKRSFWSPRNGPRRFCNEALKSAEYREMTAGLG